LGDGKYSIKKSVYEDEELNTADYLIELSFDKAGRITDETVEKLTGLTDYDDGTTHIYSYRYDDGGNLYKLIISNPDFGYDLTEETYYYDKNNNLIVYSEEYDDRPVCGYSYEYDEAGRMTSCGYISECWSREYTYSYDKNGRLVEENGYYYDFVYGDDGLEEELTRSYVTKTTYSKQGCELTVTYEWSGDADAVKSVVTYTYDKTGNRLSFVSEDYYDAEDPTNMNIYRNEYEYDEFGELLNVYYVDSDGRRVNMDDIAG
ncbi:MAG: hypothetical protein J5824_07720, partial [Lachnospiraceae bacterium]|nr:hypothetical protein [Lachnospiraceae bacterium]